MLSEDRGLATRACRPSRGSARKAPADLIAGECMELVACPLHVLFVGYSPPDREVGNGVDPQVFDEVEQGDTGWPEVQVA